MIITGEDYEIKSVVKIIKEKFKISKCGEVDCILGINVHKNHNNTYSLSQENYIKNLLKKYNINNLRKSKTPCTGKILFLKIIHYLTKQILKMLLED